MNFTLYFIFCKIIINMKYVNMSPLFVVAQGRQLFCHFENVHGYINCSISYICILFII